MSIKEIEKLREKVDKDPNSKLFVPLAEEYRKEGMMDEAIAVLQLGLERQPGYMSARVSLGKIYLEKGQMNEARIEFEHVIKSIPDNLYAHKKLAEIYRDTGEREHAIKAFRTVLKLNPMDEEILNNLRDLEGTPAEQPARMPGGASEQKAEISKEKATFEAMTLEQTSHEQEQPEAHGEPGEGGEDLDAFKESLFGIKAEEGEVIEEEPFAADEGDFAGVAELPEVDTGELSFEDVGSVPETGATEEGEALEEAGLSEEMDDAWSFGPEESRPAEEAAEEEIEEITEEAEEELSFDDMAALLKTEGAKPEVGREADFKTAPVRGDMFMFQASSGTDSLRPEERGELLRAAEGHIAGGNYLGAMNVYQRILAESPDDRKTLQGMEELRSLLKLMGKEKEVLVAKLNAFLDAVIKRGDEFHKRS